MEARILCMCVRKPKEQDADAHYYTCYSRKKRLGEKDEWVLLQTLRELVT